MSSAAHVPADMQRSIELLGTAVKPRLAGLP